MSYLVRADLHTHGTDSSQVIDPNQLADLTRERLGENGIVAIVNYADRRYEALADAAERAAPDLIRLSNAIYFPDRKVTIVRGDEINTAQGDLLTLGIGEDTRLKHGETLLDTLIKSRENNGINVITTPYFMSNVGKFLESSMIFKDYLTRIDAMEIHNGIMPPFLMANQKAEILFLSFPYSRNPIGALANSDGHTMREIGSSYTKFNLPGKFNFNFENPEALQDWLGRTIREGSRSFHKHFSALGFARHATIQLTREVADRLHIPYSRGDSKARYSE